MLIEDSALQHVRFDATVNLTEQFADRLSDRPAPKTSAEDEPKPEAVNRRWGAKPSVANQLQRMPDTVRPGCVCTMPYNLSNDEELAAMHKLQASSCGETPTVIIYETKKKFYKGVWHCCITYADLEYAQLI